MLQITDVGAELSMAIEPCEGGHFFDSAKSSHCPFCGQRALPHEPVEELDPPVGWLVAVEGVMRGADFTIRSGTNTIGSSPEMTIALEEDAAVKQHEHAVLLYDSRGSRFLLRPGSGESQVNGHTIDSAVALQPGDKLLVGGTTLVFVPLVGERFRWETSLTREARRQLKLMLSKLFSPSGRANRMDFLSIFLVWSFGTLFLVLVAGDLQVRISLASYYLAIAGITALPAWLLICATVRRLEDLNWPWMLALPWAPMSFWPVWRLFSIPIGVFPAAVLATYSAVTCILFLSRKGARLEAPIPDTVPAAVLRTEPDARSSQAADDSFNPVVGWLVVSDGIELGKEYRIHAHENRIGRDRLMDFSIKDEQVQGQNHAVIVYEPRSNQYSVAPQAGTVELNEQVLTQASPLAAYDRLRVGRTTLVFVPLCTVYHWWEWPRNWRLRPVREGDQMKSKMFGVLVIALGSWVGVGRAQTVQPPARWDKSVSVEVIAPDHKPDGKTWDLEIPVMISLAMPTLGDPAPDMMLCVVDADGAENCIHDAKRNSSGVPYSICPNKYKCNFANVKVPSSGYYGLLVIDLDVLPSKQDYMLAAVMRDGGAANPAEAWKIEKALKTAMRRWNVFGGPDEFPESAASECTIKDPCFGSSKGGSPSISVDVPEVRACGMPITGMLNFGPGEDAGSVGFQFQATANECPGAIEYVWQFGDGATETTSQARSAHSYSRAGTYTVKVIPRCIRKSSMCEAPAQSTQLTVGR